MRALLAAGLLLAAFVMPVRAAASISVNEPGPYAAFDTITLTVDPGKLKGYEYPVVIIRCYGSSGLVWTYFRRWDDGGLPAESGPEPVVLGGDPNNTSIVWNSVGGDADCTVFLYAYGGLAHPNPRLLATGPTIHVTRP